MLHVKKKKWRIRKQKSRRVCCAPKQTFKKSPHIRTAFRRSAVFVWFYGHCHLLLLLLLLLLLRLLSYVRDTSVYFGSAVWMVVADRLLYFGLSCVEQFFFCDVLLFTMPYFWTVLWSNQCLSRSVAICSKLEVLAIDLFVSLLSTSMQVFV